MHRDTPDNETVIVEYGFIDSPNDDVEQIKNNYEKYAESVVRAVLDYKGIPYSPPQDSGFYIVKKGDTLWNIANKFGITVNELKELNNMKNNSISVGMTLKVAPTEKEIIPEDYLIYKVKSGDSLWKIASEFNTTVDTIMQINNLKTTNLTINQQLFIPKSEKLGVKTQNTYTVKPGDTLYSISKDNEISVDDLIKLNNLSSDILTVGDVLVLPPVSTGEINYIVSAGDNLYTIANKYGVTVNSIKELNDLSSDIIKVGQVIKIPASTNYSTYIVKKGDSLWKIANTYGTNVNKLMVINNLNSTNLKVGQSLLIPTN